jgi:hypothetical protein
MHDLQRSIFSVASGAYSESFWILVLQAADITSWRVDIRRVSRYLPDLGWISGKKMKISGNFLAIKLRRGSIQIVSVDLVVGLLSLYL